MTQKTNNEVCNNNEQWLKVTELYLDEWKHRDGVYYKFATTFYFCAVVVSLFPYVEFVKSSIELNRGWFALAGSLIALLTSLTIFGMSLRNVKVYKKYNELLEHMDSRFKHFDSLTRIRISQVIPWLIFALIAAMNIILFLSKQTGN